MQTKDHGWEAKAAAELAKLRRFQADLEQETGNACFVGLSVVGTAQQCLQLGNERAAKRVQSEFRLTERRFWWLKVLSSIRLCTLIVVVKGNVSTIDVAAFINVSRSLSELIADCSWPK